MLNLFWALWLAVSLLGWLRWAWGEYSRGGLWLPPKQAVYEAAAPSVPAAYVAVPPPAPVVGGQDKGGGEK